MSPDQRTPLGVLRNESAQQLFSTRTDVKIEDMPVPLTREVERMRQLLGCL